MSNQLDRAIMCPVCLDSMTPPIVLCQTGHSMCGDCVKSNSIKICPQCRSPLTNARNYQLEQTIQSLPKDIRMPCFFADSGCKYLVTSAQKDAHEAECKNRKFLCEGRKYAKWKCEWFGTYAHLEGHFKDVHGSDMLYKMQKDFDVRLDTDNRDVQIISFFNGSQYFWYKHMVDVVKEKVYWTFQFIGPQKQARNYYYEFEVSDGPIRKFKVTEVCDSDVVKADRLFQEEKCVVMSFNAVKGYLNEKKKLPIKFRIMAVKKHNESSK